MTRLKIQARIVQLMKEIRERQEEIWKLSKRRDKIDSSKGDKDD